jgi:hypothetical protein
MSHRATVWAFSQKLPALQKLVLIVLADRHNGDTGRCDPSMDRVAEDCGMSKSSVKNAIRALEESGKIQAIHRFDGPVQLTNSYILHIDESTGVGHHVTGGRSPRDPGVGQEVTPNQELKPVIEPLSRSASKEVEIPKEDELQGTGITLDDYIEYMKVRKIKHISFPDVQSRNRWIRKWRRFYSEGKDTSEMIDQMIVGQWQGPPPELWKNRNSNSPTPPDPIELSRARRAEAAALALAESKLEAQG